MSHAASSSTIPLLFGKRRLAEPAMAAEYIGTDTELDTKLIVPVDKEKLPRVASN